ncbi:MAG: hypothetical protein ACUZ8I_05335, partial [Candidatus Scalindua sp.]
MLWKQRCSTPLFTTKITHNRKSVKRSLPEKIKIPVIQNIRLSSNKVGEMSGNSSLLRGWSLSHCSNRHDHKGLIPKKIPTPCRMVP